MGKLRTLGLPIRVLDTSIARVPEKQADPFYSSREWLALRDRVREEANGLCQVPGCGSRGYTVDHIVEIRDDPSRKLDRSNLMFMCQPHHVEKTHRERVRRVGR